jgi:hypothetical protein
MRVALVHFPNRYEGPDVCFWVSDDGQLASHEAVSRPEVMQALHTVTQKVDGVRWLDYFRQLSERNPDTDNWEIYRTDDPVELLETLRRIAAR